jgi:hypothetical protein
MEFETNGVIGQLFMMQALGPMMLGGSAGPNMRIEVFVDGQWIADSGTDANMDTWEIGPTPEACFPQGTYKVTAYAYANGTMQSEESDPVWIDVIGDGRDMCDMMRNMMDSGSSMMQGGSMGENDMNMFGNDMFGNNSGNMQGGNDMFGNNSGNMQGGNDMFGNNSGNMMGGGDDRNNFAGFGSDSGSGFNNGGSGGFNSGGSGGFNSGGSGGFNSGGSGGFNSGGNN